MISEIKDIETLLEPIVDSSSVILNQKISKLTAPGENYGSLILAVELRVRCKHEDKTITLVAKQIPDNEWLREMFQVQFTFVKEMEFYRRVIPLMQDFQREQGVKNIVDFFPKFYGARKNLDAKSEVVDENGVILLENLKPLDFVTGDRIIGFDRELSEVILSHLAVFHATTVALKIKKSQDFRKCRGPYTKPVRIFYDDVKHCANKMLNNYEDIIGGDEECKKLYRRVRDSIISLLSCKKESQESPFTTLVHNDLWVNNIMLKFANNKLSSIKFIDFQLIEYASLAKDVIFFLYSSVQTQVLEIYLDDLLKHYFTKFEKNLKDMGCDTSEFTFESFESELRNAACSEFFHLMFMMKPICCSPHKLKDIKDMSEEDLKEDYIPQRQKEKCCFIIKDFAKRQWI